MKKIIAILLAVLMILTASVSFVFATDYDNIFPEGTAGSKTFRIPGLYTLNDGSVIATVDMRYDHASDSPQNLDTLCAISADGYTDWEYSVINRFDDFPDGVSDSSSASYIDPAVCQSAETGRIFVITDAFPSGGGTPTAEKGSGCVEINGKKYLALTDGDNTKMSSFSYYIGDFDGEYAPVLKISDSSKTAYSVNKEYQLFKDGKALTMEQNQGNGKKVNQSVFYSDSDLTLFLTCYEVIHYSDDNGKTWSAPVILNPQVKGDDEAFFGNAPGRGFVTEYNGKERIIFCMYDNGTGTEKFSTIYSDNNGETWSRGERANATLGIRKTSETQLVSLPDGTIRAYSRNAYKGIAYADSTDGGVTFSKFRLDEQLTGRENCMVSFINYSKQIDGRNVLIASYAGYRNDRQNGVVRVGLINDDNSVDWITTYHVNQGFYAYSCLTELSDGNIGLLAEETANGTVDYLVLSVDSEGNVSEINGNNAEYSESTNFFTDLIAKLRSFVIKIVAWMGLL